MTGKNVPGHRTWYGIAACMSSCIPAVPVQADEVISAERPGFSSSPIALSPGRLQLESGYQYTRDRNSIDVDDHTAPLMLFRAGLVEHVELQLGWAGWSWTDIDGSSANGRNDATVGLKWQLTETDAPVPLALFTGVTVPVGDDTFGADGVDPAIGVFWTHSGSLDWFGTVLVSESDSDVSYANALGLGLPISDNLGAFVEYFGNFADGVGPQHNLNGGVAYLPRADLQLDLHAGIGLNRRAADGFLGLGIAYRF